MLEVDRGDFIPKLHYLTKTISICYKVLWYIKEENKELFPLINKAIQQEPLAIFYVDSRISIYSKLCSIAYSKNKESIKYMDINYVDKYLVFEIVRNEPEKVRYLDRNKEYYKEATAELVDPYNIDSIGQAIMKALEDDTSQPKLRETIMANYNISTCTNKLIESYQRVLVR